MSDDYRDDIEQRNTVDSDSPFGNISRRRLVAAGAATWASIALAGCSDTDGNGQGDSPTETVTVTSTTTTTETVAQSTSSPSGDDGDGGGSTATASPTPTDSPTPSPTPTQTPCANSMTFAKGSHVGFLIGLFETETGDLLDPERAESVTVSFPEADIDPLELTWDGKHAQFVDGRWGGKLAETGDLDPGTYQYDVTVSTATGDRVIATDQFVLVE